MDGLRDMAAALTTADKRDQLCTRGWVVTKELSSLKDGEPFNVCVLIRSLDNYPPPWNDGSGEPEAGKLHLRRD